MIKTVKVEVKESWGWNLVDTCSWAEFCEANEDVEEAIEAVKALDSTEEHETIFNLGASGVFRFTVTKDTDPAFVICDGPFADVNRWGDEIPTWIVCLGDEWGETVGEVEKYFSYEDATVRAENLAKAKGLELVFDAARA